MNQVVNEAAEKQLEELVHRVNETLADQIEDILQIEDFIIEELPPLPLALRQFESKVSSS